MRVAGLLKLRHRLLEGTHTAERLVERGGAQLGVAERVADALRGDGVLVVAGVADERPSPAERLAEEVRNRPAGESLLALRATHARREIRRQLKGLQIVGLDIAPVGLGF